jgi:Kae1-associated kinase Bud32
MLNGGVIIGKGAEAQIYTAQWEGRKAVRKVRIQKAYRHPQLDARLRKRRTAREAKILRAAFEAQVKCPQLYCELESQNELVIQWIDGSLASRLLPEKGKLLDKHLNWMRQAGNNLAKLHTAGIVHGDYTTSNIMVDSNGIVQVIDFGLSEHNNGVEEKAIDVLLFQRSLAGTSDPEKLFEVFWQAYSVVDKQSQLVMERAKKILSRGRYQQKAQ